MSTNQMKNDKSMPCKDRIVKRWKGGKMNPFE